MRPYRQMLVSFLVVLLTGCAMESEFYSNSDNFQSENVEVGGIPSNEVISKKYANARLKAQANIQAVLSQLNGEYAHKEGSRPGLELANYLRALNTQKRDSLMAIYCTPAHQIQYEDIDLYVIGLMEEVSSEKDTEIWVSFKNKYLQSGGNATSLLPQTLASCSTQVVSDCVIYTAAVIDEIQFVYKDLSERDIYCLERLKEVLAESLILTEFERVAIAILSTVPGVDLAATLLAAGYDLYSACITARDYNDCQRGLAW